MTCYVWARSRTPAWKIPRAEKPGGLQSTGLQRVGHDWATSLHVWATTTLCAEGQRWMGAAPALKDLEGLKCSEGFPYVSIMVTKVPHWKLQKQKAFDGLHLPLTQTSSWAPSRGMFQSRWFSPRLKTRQVCAIRRDLHFPLPELFSPRGSQRGSLLPTQTSVQVLLLSEASRANRC